MYVCLCNGFKDRELRAIGAEGVRCAQTAYARLGGHAKCGACLDMAERVLRDSAGANDPAELETEAA